MTMKKFLNDYANVHKDETIYLIGTGPEILNISAKYRDKIKEGTSIAVNSHHLFIENPTYHCSGHWSHYLLNCEHSNPTGCRFFQGKRPEKGVWFDSILGIYTKTRNGGEILSPHSFDRSFYDQNNTVDLSSNIRSGHGFRSVEKGEADRLFDEVNSDSPMFGSDNIAFTATHLACVMGAKKIVYIGFDQKSCHHYYESVHLLPTLQNQIKSLYSKYKSDGFLKKDIQHLWDMVKKVRSPDYLEFVGYNRIKFEKMFQCMNRNNVTPIVHNKNSVVFDAGAKLTNYDD